MENDGPVSAVQIRLAKGEITTAQYIEIISHLMKNVSSFQQTSSLKILQIRYAKSELTADQYQELLANLMNKLYSHPWSPPLHILHTRYAEGEINSAEYEEMYTTLTHEQFAYDQSTPLWFLNNRYARGDLTTSQYEEILSLFNEYTLSMQQTAMNQTGRGETSPPVHENGKSTLPKSREESSHISIHDPSPDSNSSEAVHPVLQDEKGILTEKLSEESLSDLADAPVQTETLFPEKTSPIITPSPDPVSESGKRALGTSIDSEGAQEPVQNKGIALQDEQGGSGSMIEQPEELSDIQSDKERSAMKPGSFNIPELKPGSSLLSGSSHFPSSSASVVAGAESLPSDFLYHSRGHGVGGDDDGGDVQPGSSDIQINYSISPVSSSGGVRNTYETVTSHMAASLSSESGASGIQTEESSPASEGKIGFEVQDKRQQIKLLIVKGSYQEAITLADSMILDDANDYRPYFFKGMARYYLNIHDEALEDLNHARELCKSKDEIRKIDTIRSHILCKQRADPDSNECLAPEEFSQDLGVNPASESGDNPEKPDKDLSAILDGLGKKAQDLIDAKEFHKAESVLTEFIGHCSNLSPDRLKAESVDEIYAAMGYVKYQRKDYVQAKKHFQEALSINMDNELANQFMKDILIRAAKKR